MKYSRNFKPIVFMAILFLAFYFFHIFILTDYMNKSVISDQPSVLIKVWDDNALSIGGVKYDDSKETMRLRQEAINPNNKWYLKNKRMLSSDELNCLNYGFFSTTMIKGNIDIICDDGEKIIYIN